VGNLSELHHTVSQSTRHATSDLGTSVERIASTGLTVVDTPPPPAVRGVPRVCGGAHPRTRFIVYSRSVFQTHGGEEQWVATQVARLPVLKDRLSAFIVPGREHATFRDARTANMLRARVAQVLGRESKAASN
jgi:hypothetical protein